LNLNYFFRLRFLIHLLLLHYYVIASDIKFHCLNLPEDYHLNQINRRKWVGGRAWLQSSIFNCLCVAPLPPPIACLLSNLRYHRLYCILHNRARALLKKKFFSLFFFSQESALHYTAVAHSCTFYWNCSFLPKAEEEKYKIKKKKSEMIRNFFFCIFCFSILL
jgi:hypothetical protein